MISLVRVTSLDLLPANRGAFQKLLLLTRVWMSTCQMLDMSVVLRLRQTLRRQAAAKGLTLTSSSKVDLLPSKRGAFCLMNRKEQGSLSKPAPRMEIHALLIPQISYFAARIVIALSKASLATSRRIPLTKPEPMSSVSNHLMGAVISHQTTIPTATESAVSSLGSNL